MSDRKETETTAMERWYELYKGRSDKPHVSVHFPHSLPNVYVHTTSTGCHEPDIFADGPVYATLTVGGVDFTMPYEDMELMFEAVLEAIAFGREQITEMRRRQSKLESGSE